MREFVHIFSDHLPLTGRSLIHPLHRLSVSRGQHRQWMHQRF